jgi:hypothetical protein
MRKARESGPFSFAKSGLFFFRFRIFAAIQSQNRSHVSNVTGKL